MKRTFLVTGAGGFVGRHLIPALQAEFLDSTLHRAAFDVTDRSAVAAAIRSIRPEVCIHLAGVTSVAAAQREQSHAWQVNLSGTLNLAWEILSASPDCRLIVACTAEAYGASFLKHPRADESVPLLPIGAYAASKAAADLGLGALVRDGLRVIRLRPLNHTGPGQSEHFVVPAIGRQLARIAAGVQNPEIKVGNLDVARDFTDVRDICAAYIACVRRADSLAPGSVFNLGSGVPRRVGDVLQDLVEISGLDVKISVDPALVRQSDIASAAVDATQAHQLLGWLPRIPWEMTLRDLLHDWSARVAAMT